MTNHWWKAYHGMANDVKLNVIAIKSKSRRCEVGWLWFCLLERASSNEEDRGCIAGIDKSELSALAEIPEDQVSRIMEQFIERGLISGGRLTAWEKRQPKVNREDPNANERKKNQRLRQMSRNVTHESHTGHAMSHTEKRREEERRREEKKSNPFAD